MKRYTDLVGNNGDGERLVIITLIIVLYVCMYVYCMYVCTVCIFVRIITSICLRIFSIFYLTKTAKISMCMYVCMYVCIEYLYTFSDIRIRRLHHVSVVAASGQGRPDPDGWPPAAHQPHRFLSGRQVHRVRVLRQESKAVVRKDWPLSIHLHWACK